MNAGDAATRALRSTPRPPPHQERHCPRGPRSSDACPTVGGHRRPIRRQRTPSQVYLIFWAPSGVTQALTQLATLHFRNDPDTAGAVAQNPVQGHSAGGELWSATLTKVV